MLFYLKGFVFDISRRNPGHSRCLFEISLILRSEFYCYVQIQAAVMQLLSIKSSVFGL